MLKNLIVAWLYNDSNKPIMYNRTLLLLTVGLLVISVIMITSASMSTGQRLANDPLFFTKRYSLYIVLTFCLAVIILRLPINFWQQNSSTMLVVSIIMLLVVLITGDSVNGASRWITFGPLNMQPAEFTKLALFCYLADYLVRNVDKVRNNLCGFLKPMIVILLLALLLLAQPDLGTIIVLFVTALGIFFLAGVKLWQFIVVIGMGICTTILLVLVKPYRIRRVISFWNPWDDPFGNGYQLTHSLMAFGRGELFGQGLGNSIHKIEYLQEAYTDFIFSIIGEELGYIGVVLTLFMIFLIVFHAMSIGCQALEINHYFSGFLACSIGIWFNFQTFVNVGATIGILPIKGLTLPLISYGGSSLFIMFTAVMILLRIDYETRLKKFQAFIRGSS